MAARTNTVLSITALLIAVLGVTGLAEAAWNQVLPRNSVGTLQLKRNAVKSSKIAPNAVRTAHVVNGSLLVEDFKPGQIPQGPKGDRGERGPAGATGISGYEIVTASASVPANTTLFAIQPRCPTGKKVLGGTARVMGVGTPGFFFETSVTGSTTGADDIYSVAVSNTTAAARNVFAQAICARVTE